MINILIGLMGFLKTRFGAYIMSDLFGRTAGKAAGVYKEFKARRAIRKGELDGTTAEIGELGFSPAPVEVRIQKQNIGLKTFSYITTDHEIDLKDIFHSKLKYPFVKYLEKAAQKCTSESPVVFVHLDEVLPSKYRNQYKKIIAREWKEFFSSYLNHPQTLSDAQIANGDYMEEVERIPVLVFEKDSELSQLCIHMINPAQINNLPDRENLVVRKRGEWYGLGEIMPSGKPAKSTKYETHRAIVHALKNDMKLRDMFAVTVRTGRVVRGNEDENALNLGVNNVQVANDFTVLQNNVQRIPA